MLSIFAFIVSGYKQVAKAETLDVAEGIINEQEEDLGLLLAILNQLNISATEYELECVAQKELPYMKGHSVFVIPKIVKIDDTEYYAATTLDVYILIVENETGKIIHHFYEKDSGGEYAVYFEHIEIDTAPYRLNNDTRAFGVRVSYNAHSRLHPYLREEISLFIPYGNLLVRVLKDYGIDGYRGEWDDHCEGEFIRTRSILTMSKEQTNGFYNIDVESTIENTVISLFDEDGWDCDTEETVTQSSQTLRYIDGEYK